MSELERIKNFIKVYFNLNHDEYFAVDEISRGVDNSYFVPIKRNKKEDIYGKDLSSEADLWDYLNLNGYCIFINILEFN